MTPARGADCWLHTSDCRPLGGPTPGGGPLVADPWLQNPGADPWWRPVVADPWRRPLVADYCSSVARSSVVPLLRYPEIEK